jgi:hypothetical protein
MVCKTTKTQQHKTMLSSEQKARLEQLEKEIENKRENDIKNHERRLEISKRSGIPYDLVDIDVVKIGTMLGLIKTTQGDVKSESLLNILMGLGDDDVQTPQYKTLPSYFVFAPARTTEENKRLKHSIYVQRECEQFNTFLINLLNSRVTTIDKYISLSKIPSSVESFIEQVTEAMDSVIDCLLDDSDNDELWTQLRILRSSLFGPMTVCDYKNMLGQQILKLKEKSYCRMMASLSYIDANLTMFGDKFKSMPADDVNIIYNELVIRTHLKDPELKAFDLSSILKECCVPSFMFTDKPHHIIKCGIIGPYRHNCIGYLSGCSRTSFYILKRIHEGGIRMWVLDELLTTFSEQLRQHIMRYCVRLFRTYTKALTGTNMFIEPANMSHIQINLLRTISFMLRPHDFRKYICSLIASNSCLVPTELDVFNEIHYRQEHVVSLALSLRPPVDLFDTPISKVFTKTYLMKDYPVVV